VKLLLDIPIPGCWSAGDFFAAEERQSTLKFPVFVDKPVGL